MKLISPEYVIGEISFNTCRDERCAAHSALEYNLPSRNLIARISVSYL